MSTTKENFEQKFEAMHWTAKARAIGALERQNEKDESQKLIVDEVEKHGDRVIDVTEFAGYHFIKYRSSHDRKEMYQVYINGNRCSRITNNPKIILLIALAKEFDGSNTQADRLISQMFGLAELEEEAK